MTKKNYLIFLFVLIFLPNCSKKEKLNGSINIYDSFDYEKFEFTKNTLNNYKKYYIQAVYKSDTLKELNYISKKQKAIIQRVFFYYTPNNKFLITRSKLMYRNIEFNLRILSIIYNGNLCRIYFILKDKKLYLSTVDRQIKKNIFKRSFINLNKYCNGYNDFFEFVNDINKINEKKYFFNDYLIYSLSYKNKKIEYTEIRYLNWGTTKPIAVPEIITNKYDNLLLDFEEIDKFKIPLDNSILNCLNLDSTR